MRIAWHGHACFEVQGEEGTVVTDPHDGRSLGIRAPSCRADLVLVSHDHFDHNAVHALKGEHTVLRDPGPKEVKGIKLKGVEAAHDDAGGAKRGRVTMFRFELGGVAFLHCGDLGQALTPEQLRSLGKVDVLFVPVGGVFTLDGKQARKAVQDINPRIAIPMHYRYGGLTLSIHPVDGFLEALPKSKVHHVGSSIEFSGEELPQETEYWVFSP
jgi:L-ascorbate metabolism protein UlaG (beta-lactamase superfamily)